MKLQVEIKAVYDTELDSMYVTFTDKKPDQTVALNNFMIADLDDKQRIVGLEFVGYSKLDKKALKL